MIKNCRSCKSNKLIEVLNLGSQFLSHFVDPDAPKPESHPLELIMCQECGLVQLKHTVDPSKLYGDDYGYYSGINNTIRSDLKDIAEKAMEKSKMAEGGIIVDIGSNDATLLKNYHKGYRRIGFDPVTKFKKYYDEENLTFINDYFSYKRFRDLFPTAKAGIITAISMFYDLDEPNQFVSDLKKTLSEDGLLIIQQNYLAGMIIQHAYDNIVHEHLEYYSLESLTKLLNRHELEIVDASVSDINGGSFRVYVRHMSTLKRMRLLEKRLKLANPSSYLLFGMKVQQLRSKLHKFIKGEVEKGKSIYLYGASTRINTLLQYCGLDNTLIKAAVERNPDKWGKKMASVDIPIISEEQMRKEKPDYLFIGPWYFSEEFKKREEEYIKSGGKLIIPLPEVVIIDESNYRSNPLS